MVEHVKAAHEARKKEGAHGHGHDHGHKEASDDHGHGHDDSCKDPSHGHEHGHGHEPEHAHEHSHAEQSHGHDHAHGDDCSICKAGEQGGGHGHGHGHDHSHAERPVAREAKRFGITSFCYQRRRPFHPSRLMKVIRQLPVRQQQLALADCLTSEGAGGSSSAAADASAAAAAAGDGTAGSPMLSLIRSKGFVWLSNSDSQIFYWALAGKHFELKQCVPHARASHHTRARIIHTPRPT
eukprot:6423015-Prymnesium_polylepis.1